MKLYDRKDMVKVGCHDCRGCSSCCRKMGDTVVLDPFDAYSLAVNMGRPFGSLLENGISLHVEDGLILPHVEMVGEEEKCFFLNREGRCSIHAYRPGLCRAFPLGRNYGEGRLDYFLLEKECPAQNRTKMKIDKWIGIASPMQYEEFLITWHYFIKKLKETAKGLAADGEETLKSLNINLLECFYLRPYDAADFYSYFQDRIEEWSVYHGYDSDKTMPHA